MNPWFLCYASTAGVVEKAGPTAIFVADSNRLDPEFQAARGKGAELFGYFNVNEVTDTRVSQLRDDFYMGDRISVPRWPTGRVNWPNTQMLDVRVGSTWVNFAVDYLAERMTDGMLDGFFLDVIGARLWSSLADWASWPLSERHDWQAGIVDFLRRLDQARRQLNPQFKFINNNRWYDTYGKYFVAGEPYVDGICLENIDPIFTTTQNEANRPFSNLGHRRVLTISKTMAHAQAWALVPGVTHVCYTNNGNYGTAQDAAVPCTDLRLPELRAYVETLKAAAAAGTAALAEVERLRQEVIHLTNTVSGLSEDNAALANYGTSLQQKLQQIHEITLP
jgi:hypothetical protein